MASKQVIIKDYIRELPGTVNKDGEYEFVELTAKDHSLRERFWIVKVVVFKNNKKKQLTLDNIPTVVNDKIVYEKLDIDKAHIVISRGIRDGTVTTDEPNIITSGKNIGKKNETTILMQALRQAYSEYKKTVDHGYFNKYNAPPTWMIPPMLATSLKSITETKRKKMEWKGYVQPKYNGLRAVSCMLNGEIKMYSRANKEYPLFDNLQPELKKLLDDIGHEIYLDGELYKHGLSLQDISGEGRRVDINKTLDYYIFDCFRTDKLDIPYSKRLEIINSINKHKLLHIKLADTFEVNNEKEVMELYNGFLKNDYEGAIFRTHDMHYDVSYLGYRSPDLIKIKPRESKEYNIVDYTAGQKGREVSAVIFICEVPDNKKRFKVRPKGTIEYRKELYLSLQTVMPSGKTLFEEQYLNQPYTIEYAELSKDKVPQQPVGIALRTGLNAV